MAIPRITPDYVTIPEAAEMLGVSRQRVGVLVRSGRIEGARMNEYLWEIPISSVKAFEAQPRGRPAKPKQDVA